MSKYFSEDELRCKCGCGQCLMDDFFLILLDSLREEVDEPIGVVSGYRCPKHDLEVKGEGNHPYGEAVDLAAPTSHMKFKIVKAALQVGITRIGIGKTFVHLDIVKNHPERVVWLY